LITPNDEKAGQFLNKYFFPATDATKDGYKSLYTFNIKLNYYLFTDYVYLFYYRKELISITENIYIMGQKIFVSTKTQNPDDPHCVVSCNISDSGMTYNQDPITITITPDSLISNIEFIIDKNINNNPKNDKNIFGYGIDPPANFNFEMGPTPLTLTTSYQLSNIYIGVYTKIEIPLYDNIRTQTINQKKISSDFNNGFYYINNSNNTFIILATTQNVNYSFGGEFFFNMVSVPPSINFTLNIYAIIDDNSPNTTLILIGTKDFKNSGQLSTPVKVSVDIKTDMMIVLNKKTTHTIKLYWEIVSGNLISINIVDTDKSYFNFIVNN
jgi:hypothetical protein